MVSPEHVDGLILRLFQQDAKSWKRVGNRGWILNAYATRIDDACFVVWKGPLRYSLECGSLDVKDIRDLGKTTVLRRDLRLSGGLLSSLYRSVNAQVQTYELKRSFGLDILDV